MKKFLFLLPLAILLIWGCSRSADVLQSETVPVGSHVFSRQEVIEMLATNGVSIWATTLTDASYVAPEAKWVESQYSSRLGKFLFDFNLNHWTVESFDCDDISRAAATYASMLFHNGKNRPKGHGFLFGEFHYLRNQSGHAINILIVKDGANYRLMFYEPQLKREILVSSSEKTKTMWLRF